MQECPIDLDENLAFEETLYKQHLSKPKNDHEMYKEQKTFTPYKKLSITDIVKVTDHIIGISYFDGNIVLFNTSGNKKDAKIVHGTFCSCLCTIIFNKKIRLLSAGTLDG